MRALTVKGWSSVAAFFVLAAIVIAAACARPQASKIAANSSSSSMAAGFERCRALGEAAPSDPDCRALWRQENQHFLGSGRR